MTSKKLIENAINESTRLAIEAENCNLNSDIVQHYHTMTNDLKQVLNDLEVLEILKKSATIFNNELDIEDIDIYIFEENEGYEKVKSWLNEVDE